MNYNQITNFTRIYENIVRLSHKRKARQECCFIAEIDKEKGYYLEITCCLSTKEAYEKENKRLGL